MASKRGAGDYLTKDGPAGDDMQNGEPATRATAAQLANRKIKSAKGRRPGGPARVGSTGLSSSAPAFNLGAQPVQQPSQSSAFGGFGGQAQTGGLFGTPASSFPPTNGTSINGNGTPSASFPAFGSGATGSGFNFAAPAAVNNPFSNPSGAANGTSGPGINFNFGQPVSAPASSTTGIFSFGQSGQTPQQSAVAQTPAPSFGATPATPNFGGSIFSQPSNQPAANPFGNIFGKPTNTGTQAPTFGVPAIVDDAMSTSPDNSPRKTPAPSPANGGQLASTTASSIKRSFQATAPTEGENDRPHIEEEKPKPTNPFAALPRPPKETQKPEASKIPVESKQSSQSSTFQFGAPATSSPGIGSSVFQSASNKTLMGQSSITQPSATPATPPQSQGDQAPKPSTPSTPSTLFGQSSTSTHFGQKSAPVTGMLGAQTTQATAASTPASTPFFKPATSSQPTNSVTSSASPTNLFASTPKTAAAMPNLTQASTTPPTSQTGTSRLYSKDFTNLVSTYIKPAEMHELLREDNIPPPPAELELTEEEVKYYYMKYKQGRLNVSYRDWFKVVGTDKNFQNLNLIPMMANYIHMYEKIMGEPIGGRLTDIIQAHGQEAGERMYNQERGCVPLDGTTKRKLDGNTRHEGNTVDFGKKAKTGTTQPQPAAAFAQSSNTANKFRDLLEDSNKATSTSTSTQPQVNGHASGTTNFFPSFGKPVDSSSASSVFSAASKPATTPSSAQFNSATSSTFKVPTFGVPKPGAFTSQFGDSAAKTAAKEKEKRKAEDFDSEDDDEEEWERKDAEEQEAKRKRLLQEAAPVKAPIFGAPKSNSLAPPSTNGGFSSRSASPAGSTSGGTSVFDLPRSGAATPTPGNIFGHLSEQGSDVDGSGKGDADDEDEASSEEEVEAARVGKTPSNESSRAGPFSESDDAPSDAPTGRSLFDRITRDGKSEDKAVPTTEGKQNSLFGHTSKDDKPDRAPLSTTQGNQTSMFNFTKTSPGDRTWKPDSPIRFGNSTTDKSSASASSIFVSSGSGNAASTSLFGFSTTPSKPAPSESTTPAMKPFTFAPTGSTTPQFSPTPRANTGSIFSGLGAKPSTSGFSLFPPSTPASALSRATTPGVSDISGTESPAPDAEDEAPVEPSNDLVNISQSFDGDTVLFQADKVKASKMTVVTDDEGKEKKAWATQGVGPIAILEKKDSGKVRMLMKSVPRGNVVVHTYLLKKIVYEQLGKKARFMIIGETGLPENWVISGFPTEEDAKAFVKACEDGKTHN